MLVVCVFENNYSSIIRYFSVFSLFLSLCHLCLSELSHRVIAGASGLVAFDEDGERNLDYYIYDLQHMGDVTKFVPILQYDSQTKAVR